MYDLIIIGGGPAGITAGIYAARKKIKTAIIAEIIGGQIINASFIENWPGEESILGVELAKKLESHLKRYNAVDIFENENIKSIIVKQTSPYNTYAVVLESGKSFDTKTIIISSGSNPRRLNIPGEKEYEKKGVVFCSICDSPLFKNKEVVVVGGGNAGFSGAMDLLPYASKIYILEFSNVFKGDSIVKDKLLQSGKVEFVSNAKILRVNGNNFVESIDYEDMSENKEKNLKVQGVFVSIGLAPSANFTGDLVDKDQFGYIVVDHKTNATSTKGIFAAGDVTDLLFRQAIISSGEGANALLSADAYLKSLATNENKQL